MQVSTSNWYFGNNRGNITEITTKIEENHRKGNTIGKDWKICRWFRWFPILYIEGSLKYLLSL